jgi:alpha-glucosidase (family GH31 glycosyl hydrolase)
MLFRKANKRKRFASLLLTLMMVLSFIPTNITKASEDAGGPSIGKVSGIDKKGSDVFIELSTGEGIKMSFLKENVFRLHLDPDGKFPEYPTPNKPDHETKIVDKDQEEYNKEYGATRIRIKEDSHFYRITTKVLELKISKADSKMSLMDKKRNKILWSEKEPLTLAEDQTVQTLNTKGEEYFYGGGQQNGYYSHKNTKINIAIGGGWDAGSASSPVPFYLSTEGYGVMRNTFKPGVYDFSETATFSHQENRFDAYYFIDDSIPEIIDEYTELTGKAALMPEYAFYLGHADCFNGVHNGHKDKRTLLGKGMDTLNEYVNKDMPIGWFLPNDGYGCGYNGLDNLNTFVDEANDQNVEVGLWTQSNLYPDPNLPEDSPLQRDLDGEVQAGVRAIKTDVAWVGQGYSMALNATRQAAEGIEKQENSGGARPFVISLDGWAGTQRYATLWSGDQYGGEWEYIRMHIPTYIGAGLSGNPNVGSDMDGIFGGDPVIQTRDFQWKAFSPIQIDMDGWASSGNDYSKSKNPWNYGEPYTSINRMYLKLKSQMMPYIYTIAEESTSTSMPSVRGMMLEYPEDPFTYGTETQYQYMWGPNLLVAPVYNEKDQEAGVRNGIYLPDKEQIWIDYFTGEQHKGGAVVNHIDAPLWKTPVFVKNGAIIPMAPANNSINELDGSENRIFDIYPSGKSEFTLYEDDGKTVDYKSGKNTKTKITSVVANDKAKITVHKAKGKGYDGMVKDRGTEFLINTRKQPESVTVKVGGKNVKLKKAGSEKEYNQSENVYFYNESPNLNTYATEGSEFAETKITTAPKLYVKVGKTDITKKAVRLTVNGFDNTQVKEIIDEEVPAVPAGLGADDETITDKSITLHWDEVEGENISYDLKIGGMIYRNVFVKKEGENQPYFEHEDLDFDTEYSYQIRAVNSKGASEWSDEVTIKTKLDPFRNVPENMTATASSHQPGSEASKAVDGDAGTQWHTQWFSGNVPPHTFEIDMKLAYQLDQFEYVPRPDAGNGTILKYDLEVSLDGKAYKEIVTDGTFERSKDIKTIPFKEDVTARYIKLTIKDAVGGFGSAQEFRPYKKDKTEGMVVGENIPNGAIDEEDLLFFASYMGVDSTDTSWDQVSKVDINYNEVIDAYDLMYVAGQLGETKLEDTGRPVAGMLSIRPDKQELKAGEEVTVEIIGAGMKDINAFNLEMEIDPNKYEIITSCESEDGCGDRVAAPTDATKEMLNYSILAGIGNDKQRVMTAFSNKGSQATLEGTSTLAVIKLKAKRDGTFDVPITRSLLVNTDFDTVDQIGDVLQPGEEPGEVEQPEEPEELLLTARDMTVTGEADKMQDGAAAFPRLIDGEISESSLAELKWSITEADGISLPLTVDFTFNDPQELTTFEVFNRPLYTNGKIKKLRAIGTDEEGNEYDLGTKEVLTTDQKVTFELTEESTKLKKVTIVFEESHSGPLMLSVAEVQFRTKNSAYQGE